MIESTVGILEKLVAFDTTSRNSNLNLVDYVSGTLKSAGIASTLVPNAEGTKANLIARIGPDAPGGIVLSGHTDVVPVDGQTWNSDPFKLKRDGELLFGRGTTDMKGFIACALRMAPVWASQKLKQPIYMVFSYDEEIGCLGVGSALAVLRSKGIQPDLCIVGEPTLNQVAYAHKSRADINVHAQATGGHASKILDPSITSAHDLASIFHVGCLHHGANISRALGESAWVGPNSMAVTRWEIPNTHNIIPAEAHVHYDFRGAPGMTAERITAALEPYARAAERDYAATGKTGTSLLRVEAKIGNPGFHCLDVGTINLAKKIAATKNSGTADFVCEAARFAEHGFGDKTVICGPGNILQAHQPNEFIHRGQLGQCLGMMRRVSQHAMA